MIQECVLIMFFLQINSQSANPNKIPIYNLRHVSHIKPRSLLTSIERLSKQYCFIDNKWLDCAVIDNIYGTMDSITNIGGKLIRKINSNIKSHILPELHPAYRHYTTSPAAVMSLRPLTDFHSSLPIKPYPVYHPGLSHLPKPDVKHNMHTAWNTPLHPHSELSSSAHSYNNLHANGSSIVSHNRLKLPVTMTTAVSGVPQHVIEHKNLTSINKFTENLDVFERQFYKITFTKLTDISPVDRQENGMSFVQSGFFLLLTLVALWTEVDSGTRAEIDQCIGFNVSDVDSVGIVRHFITTLPNSSDKLKFRRSSRLMLWPRKEASLRLQGGAAAALMLQVEKFNGTETSEKIATILNQKVELDSGGAIHDTFDEDDVSGGVTAVLVTTLYVRGRWRTAPTVLNGTRPFRDTHDSPHRTVRMIRINDVMKYADLREWDAQALEISYATPGLTLLMLIPRNNSLKSLVQHVSNTSIGDIIARMKTMRVAATVPIYTLRMTLLLPNKLQALGIPRLVDVSNGTQASSLRLSHAVQRIMFWAEAGRNAYKDDGIEWDQAPELQVAVDRPYIFFVRWRNVTIMNGNFVL